MSHSNSTSTHGITFLGALALIFITLKLTNTIDWSWWWITSPLWIPVAVKLSILGIVWIWLRVRARRDDD